tara:strand:- start:1619 stop:2125 length:507 start_codon:yes stop_codon:yes gene_type:complete
MIINCNSCDKKFVVPDQAITSLGRMVQCGSCGNKWKQYPKNEGKITPIKIKKNKRITKTSETKIPKPKKKISKKKREIDLYSPEYLAKKHGINLNETNDKPVTKNKVSFGFYGSLIILLVILIGFSRSLYFLQDIITTRLPFTEYYLKYFFESIRNLFEIFKNLISNY